MPEIRINLFNGDEKIQNKYYNTHKADNVLKFQVQNPE